jgi:hypothetical protein
MFVASKLLVFLTQPLAWVAALVLAALVLLGKAQATSIAITTRATTAGATTSTRGTSKSEKALAGQHRWSLRLLWLALFVLLVQGWEPLPDALLRQLEDPYTEAPAGLALQAYQGVVVLGGALEPSYVWEGRSQIALNDAAERMVVPLSLLRQKPQLQLLFTGGEGDWFGQGLSEAARARIFYQSLGLAPQQLWVEDRSRTTFENAVFSARLAGVDPTQPWLLMTSAWHMRRALATFQKAGWNVTPYAVDFSTGSRTPWSAYSLVRGSRKWALLLHELLGLAAYRLAGRA